MVDGGAASGARVAPGDAAMAMPLDSVFVRIREFKRIIAFALFWDDFGFFFGIQVFHDVKNLVVNN